MCALFTQPTSFWLATGKPRLAVCSSPYCENSNCIAIFSLCVRRIYLLSRHPLAFHPFSPVGDHFAGGLRSPFVCKQKRALFFAISLLLLVLLIVIALNRLACFFSSSLSANYFGNPISVFLIFLRFVFTIYLRLDGLRCDHPPPNSIIAPSSLDQPTIWRLKVLRDQFKKQCFHWEKKFLATCNQLGLVLFSPKSVLF